MFGSIGEGTMYYVDNKTYKAVYKLYENQKVDGYSDMLEDIHKALDDGVKRGKVTHTYLQWNSHDHLKKPITFRRMIQFLEE